MTSGIGDTEKSAETRFFALHPDASLSLRAPTLNPADWAFKLASRGEVAGQRAIIDHLVGEVTPGNLDESLHWIEMFSRMAMQHGEAQDRYRHVSILGLLIDRASELGNDERATAFQIESVALIDAISDEGGECAEIAANNLESIVKDLSPAIIAAAKEYRKVAYA